MVAQARGEWGTAAPPTVDSNPKARVYVYRYGGFGGCGVKPFIWCDEVLLASITCGRYFIAEIEPGPHTFRSDNSASTVSLNFAAGRTYFLRADIVPDTIHDRGLLYKMEEATGSRDVRALKPLPSENIQDDTMVLTE